MEFKIRKKEMETCNQEEIKPIFNAWIYDEEYQVRIRCSVLFADDHLIGFLHFLKFRK